MSLTFILLGNTFEENCTKDQIMNNLMLLRLDQLTNIFPDVKTDIGLIYYEPAPLAITAVMTQLRSVLFEYTILAELEQNTAIPSSKQPVVVIDPKQPVKKPKSKEPTRLPSIRHKGNKPPASISVAQKVSEPPTTNNKRPCVLSAGTSPARKRSTNDLSKTGYSDTSEIEYTEESLMLKTKENLFAICMNLHIDISHSSKKDVIISAILQRKTRFKSVLPHQSEKIDMHATGSRVTDVLSLRSARLEEPSNTTTMQNQITANIGKAMDSIESRLSSNLTACVSETKRQSSILQEELVATKATLAAERQQKKEYKKEATETLNEHVEIFGKISQAATKPLMDVMRLFTQTNMAAIEKNASSSTVKPDFPHQPLVNPSSTPMIVHNYHQHQHHAVLPSSAYAPPYPSVEHVMLHPYSSNPHMVPIFIANVNIIYHINFSYARVTRK